LLDGKRSDLAVNSFMRHEQDVRSGHAGGAGRSNRPTLLLEVRAAVSTYSDNESGLARAAEIRLVTGSGADPDNRIGGCPEHPSED